jgi:hypothetical protein
MRPDRSVSIKCLFALNAETAHALLGTFLLTGGRQSEILGVEVPDISIDRTTVTIRPNDWRWLKTLTSARVVPLWPQLAEILQPYIFNRPPALLLFPSFVTGREAMLTDSSTQGQAIAPADQPELYRTAIRLEAIEERIKGCSMPDQTKGRPRDGVRREWREVNAAVFQGSLVESLECGRDAFCRRYCYHAASKRGHGTAPLALAVGGAVS